MVKLLVIVLMNFMTALAAAAHQGEGKVVSVIDGNTIEVLAADGDTYQIVFSGIDSPELEQDFGDHARKFLSRLVLDKRVSFSVKGKDRKGNYIAIVFLKNGVDPRIELLKEGLAWTVEKDPVPELEVYHQAAREKGKGIWKDENPTPPWIFRRQQSMIQPKSS